MKDEVLEMINRRINSIEQEIKGMHNKDNVADKIEIEGLVGQIKGLRDAIRFINMVSYIPENPIEIDIIIY